MDAQTPQKLLNICVLNYTMYNSNHVMLCFIINVTLTTVTRDNKIIFNRSDFKQSAFSFLRAQMEKFCYHGSLCQKYSFVGHPFLPI